MSSVIKGIIKKHSFVTITQHLLNTKWLILNYKQVKNNYSLSYCLISVFTVLFLFAGISFVPAQNGVRIASSTGTADPSAMLDVVATNKGFLVPRMTAAQRGAIGSPATGLLVYQTDGAQGLYYFTGPTGSPVNTWVQLSAGALSGAGTANYVAKWTSASAIGNSQIYDNGTNVGIGTTGLVQKLQVGAGNNDGIIIGNYNDQLGWNGSGTAPEYSLRFAGYRDVIGNFVGAKISAIRTNICCSGLSQGMELSFQTQELTAGVGGDGNLIERLRIGNGGTVKITNLAGTGVRQVFATSNGTLTTALSNAVIFSYRSQSILYCSGWSYLLNNKTLGSRWWWW